jgi:intein/homing endonuclease
MNNLSMPVKVTAFVGDMEVIGNGIVQVSNSQQLILNIDNLKMSFCFSSDTNNPSSKWSSVVEGDTLVWQLVNFNNSLGEGVLNQIKIGALNKRELFATFYVWTIDKNQGFRNVNYVIYLGRTINE